MSSDNGVPQWKKDLIARLRSQNRRTATAAGRQQLFDPPQRTLIPTAAVQQPVRSEPVAFASSREKCESETCPPDMVQDRRWESDSESSAEDLHYGPGIVHKLRERYLNLAQRQTREPVALLRKAASMENILDEPPATIRLYQPRVNGTDNRYRKPKRSPELKRARSVETISSSDERVKEPKRESLHEEMLITTEGNDVPTVPDKKPDIAKPYTPRLNKPKRIAPVMNEKEKPPADVVKQAKMIFERRPEQRTRAPQQTGDVAAKVATYKNIIVQAKAAKKPVVRTKPVITEKPKTVITEKPKTNGIRTKREAVEAPRAKTKTEDPVDAPQDIVKTETVRVKSPETAPPSLKVKVKPDEKSEDVPPPPKSPDRTPSLPSPIPDISRVDFKTHEDTSRPTSLSETPDLIITSSPLPAVNSPSFRISATENFIKEEIRLATTERVKSPVKESVTFNFVNNKVHNHLPAVNKNVLNTQTPPSQPLKLEINGVSNGESAKPNLTTLEIEKNLINTAKTLQKPASVKVEEVTVKKVPKVRKPPREPENNSIVFDFTHRDVPDYVHNDGVKRATKPEKPKVGEGGIILLPGASIDESFTDEDEELLRSLEGPPSPCDVMFINDNILIDGKSSLSQKTKKAKMKISFVEEGPEVYEYPSESSLLIEDTPKSPPTPQMRTSVPSLSGTTSLANYTPKGTADFQPGVTRSVQSMPKAETPDTAEPFFEEVETPILFSAGANSDILF